MKKQFLSCLLISSLVFTMSANAQLSQGGIPASSRVSVNAPQLNTYQITQSWEEVQNEYYNGNYNKPALVSQKIDVNIGFPNSGSFTYLDNGDIIWQAELEIPNAPAIGLFFNQFKLVKGSTLYVKSANGKQILGGYTEDNNSPDLLFSIEPSLGAKTTIELNIKAGTNLDDIKLHIDKAMVYHQAIEHLKEFLTDAELQLITGTDPDPYGLEGSSSECMINAACEVGASHPLSRRAAIQMICVMPQGTGVCSATLVNNTGNTSGNCKTMVLLASHSELSGTGQSDNFYSQWQARFNFEKDQCTGGPAAKQNTITGLNFKTRSVFTSAMEQNPNLIESDYLLLELRNPVPATYNSVIAGWDRNTMPQQVSGNEKYIAFHHPAGDVKKILQGQIAAHNGQAFYQLQLNNAAVNGGGAQGSSGGGVFKDDGYLLGDASTAGPNPNNPAPAQCEAGGKQFFNVVNYYRISHAWDWAQSTNGPLKNYLDPTNSNTMRLNPVSTSCGPITTSVYNVNSLDGKVNVFPIPTTDGRLNVQFNLEDAQSLQIELYDLTGKRLLIQKLDKVTNNNYTIDVNEFNTGMYMLKISNANNSITKKISIVK